MCSWDEWWWPIASLHTKCWDTCISQISTFYFFFASRLKSTHQSCSRFVSEFEYKKKSRVSWEEKKGWKLTMRQVPGTPPPLLQFLTTPLLIKCPYHVLYVSYTGESTVISVCWSSSDITTFCSTWKVRIESSLSSQIACGLSNNSAIIINGTWHLLNNSHRRLCCLMSAV